MRKEDTDANGGQDRQLESDMVRAMQVVKAWASKGAKKLGDAANANFLTGGTETKKVVKGLLGRGDFSSNANDIKAKFERLENLEGPIGGDASDNNKKYDASEAWKKLEKDDKHYQNFVSDILVPPDTLDVLKS
jgi:hypothetical protein